MEVKNLRSEFITPNLHVYSIYLFIYLVSNYLKKKKSSLLD